MPVPDAATLKPASNNWPIVKLRAVGDGRAVSRALLRVLVRRALISEGIINDGSIAGNDHEPDDSRCSAS